MGAWSRMSDPASQRAAGTGRIATFPFGDYVVAAAANGRLFAVALGDGTVRLIDSETLDAESLTARAHAGAALCLAADIDKGAFLSGGDDGKLVRIAAAGAIDTLAEIKGRWIDHVTTHAGGGIRAYASGKDAFVLGKKGGEARKLSHATSVGGLAINPKGKRLAATHYNGVSLWWLAAKDSEPVRLEWKGSHLNALWSPDGDYVLTAMQENALHGWRLSDGEHMRMSGYAGKIRSMAFTRRGHFLATGGSDHVICWPFTGGGPMGKAPAEFGGAGEALVTAVAAHPLHDVMAAGFENGALMLGQPGLQGARLVMKPNGNMITALVWNPDGDKLLAGTEGGDVHVADFRPA
jgi:WD40 repeat protein